jgi:hypothetical protein
VCGAIAASVASCGGRPIGWERDHTVIGPIPLKNRVAYVDGARDRVVVIDTDADAPRIETFAIGRRAVFAAPSPDREHLIVLTRGEEAIERGQVDEAPMLWNVDVADPASAPVGYLVGSPFDRVVMAPDGDGGAVAVAYFRSAGPDDGGVFRNPNELAVVDLGRGPGDDNPVLKTVRSFGSAPTGVVLSPPMHVPGTDDGDDRVFAFVLAPETVTLIDTVHPERNEVSVRLDGAGDDVMPRELAFEPASGTAYLRSDGAGDVLEIGLSSETPRADDARDNDYRPLLAELGAGGGPADFAVYDNADGNRFVLAATPSTHQVVVIDADTGEFTKVDTPDAIDRVLLFPSGPGATPRVAVLAAIGSRVPRVHLLSLDGITDDLVPVDVDTVELDEPVLDVVPVPGRPLGLIVHDDNRTVLGLLDVGIGSVAPLQGVGRLDGYDFTADGDYLVGVTAGVDRVGFVDLSNLHPSSLRLDEAPTRLFTMPGGAVFVDHGDPLGLATILPGPEASRDEAIVVSGFLLDDILDEEL